MKTYILLCFLSFFSVPMGIVCSQDLLDKAANVPQEFKGNLYKLLEQEKQDIDSERTRIENDIKKLNIECSHVSSNDSHKVSYCAEKQGKIYDRMEVYDALIQKYHVKIQASPPNRRREERSLNKNNYSTSGFWLDWLEYIRQENRFFKLKVKEYKRQTDDVLEDLSTAYDNMQNARKVNDLSARAVALETMRNAYRALDVIEKAEKKTLKPKALAVVATSTMHIGKYDEAIVLFKRAIEAEENSYNIDKLRKAMGLAMYKRDQLKGNMKDNPKTAILLDALGSGNGNYEKSIDYLRNGIDGSADDIQVQNYRDVLNYVEGMHTYDQFLNIQKQREEKKRLMQLPDR